MLILGGPKLPPMLNTVAIWCFLGALGKLASASPYNASCVCTYGKPCWPSADEFAQLQSEVSQPLIYPLPTASACYPIGNPSGNCSDVIQHWNDGNWRSDLPGSMDSPNFESFIFKNDTISACYLNTTLGVPCEQGSVPVVGVDARTPEDIQAAVKFAVRYNLKLVVKNTGHDLLGRSTARGAFLVWTHHMKNITLDSNFAPQGSPTDETFDAVTLAAGVQWYEAYQAVDLNGRMMVGGLSGGGSVGAAGGWLQGGGHSVLSPSYGLGVDNAIEITVVTSTGEHLTVNNYQYSDLFWALLGGGGGTYGIITSVTYRTYPSVPVVYYEFQANTTNPVIMKEILSQLLHLQTNFTDEGWGGYAGMIGNTSIWNIMLAPNISIEAVNASTRAWTNWAQTLEPQGVTSAWDLIPYSSWYQWYTTYFSTPNQDGNIAMVTSRLLSRDLLSKRYQDAADVLFECQGGWSMIAGGKVSQIDANSTGLNPAWRNAVVEAECGVSWEEGASVEEIQAEIDQLKTWIQMMHDLAPNTGAYFNEASLYEIDWKYTFFGPHYATLKEIKDKYDPYRLFVIAEGVGSEEWNSELTCRL